MNEREQWLKNHLVRSEHTEFGWQECHRYEFDELEIKELTELIVKECCDLFVELRTRPADLAVKDVKKHFGVK